MFYPSHPLQPSGILSFQEILVPYGFLPMLFKGISLLLLEYLFYLNGIGFLIYPVSL